MWLCIVLNLCCKFTTDICIYLYTNVIHHVFKLYWKTLWLKSEKWHDMNSWGVSPLCWIFHGALTTVAVFRGYTRSAWKPISQAQTSLDTLILLCWYQNPTLKPNIIIPPLLELLLQNTSTTRCVHFAFLYHEVKDSSFECTCAYIHASALSIWISGFIRNKSITILHSCTRWLDCHLRLLEHYYLPHNRQKLAWLCTV